MELLLVIVVLMAATGPFVVPYLLTSPEVKLSGFPKFLVWAWAAALLALTLYGIASR